MLSKSLRISPLRIFAVSGLLSCLCWVLPAAALQPATGKVILTISGKVGEKNTPQAAAFDCTINVNAKEAPRPPQPAARPIPHAAQRGNDDDSVVLGDAILNNALPDVYPEDRR